MNASAIHKPRLNPIFLEEVRRTLVRTVSRVQRQNFGRQPHLAASIQTSSPELASLPNPKLTQDYYQLLGVSQTASREDIIRAAKQRAAELKRAYSVLINEDWRKIYDSKLSRYNAADIEKITIRVHLSNGNHDSLSL